MNIVRMELRENILNAVIVNETGKYTFKMGNCRGYCKITLKPVNINTLIAQKVKNR